MYRRGGSIRDESASSAAYSAPNSSNEEHSGIWRPDKHIKRTKTTTGVEICFLFVQRNDKRGHVREIPRLKCAPFIVLPSPELVVEQHLMSCVLGTREHGGA